MAERYDFYVHDNRKITFNLTEPIMREDSGVTDFVFHIPKILNELEVSDWSWWLVFVNAKKEKYSIALNLSEDPESPLEKNIGIYTVDYAMSIKAGSVQFALEAINTGTGGAIDNEWHTLTYETKVKETLQGNQAEYAETESDIISALLEEVRTKMNQVIGGATPEPVNLKSQMTDPQKVYLYIGSEPNEHAGHWYYHNGTNFVPGGLYGAGITDAVPTQGSTNAVSSGGVYEALQSAGLSEDAKTALLACFEHVAWIDEHGQTYYNALESALYGSEPYWDYEWNASSGTLPEDMTADAYDFTTEPGGLYIQKPNLDFDHIGNCRIQIEAKFFNKSENDDPLYIGNNPQMVITNAQPSTGLYQGIKIITGSTLNPENPKTHNMVAVGINGTNTLIDDVYATDYHVYDIIANNNVYSLSIDGETVSLTQNSNTNAYFGTTGITAATDNAKFFACIKSIKFRRGEA